MEEAEVKLNLLQFIFLTLPSIVHSQPVAFEVADVHSSKDAHFATGGFLPGGHLELRGWTVLELITLAYGVEQSAIAGGPNWLDDDRFDISARSPAPSDARTGGQMLQRLLSDRFKLVMHADQKPRPVFMLTVAKKSAGLVESEASPPNCAPYAKEGSMFVDCRGISMGEFANRIRQWSGVYLNHPVVDKTGLAGTYDLTLRWSAPSLLVRTDEPEAQQDQQNQSLFKAVEDQLGLKITAGKELVPVLTVDNVSRVPTPNIPDITKFFPKETQFEVADLKPSRPGEASRLRISPGGRIDAQAIPLKTLLFYAFTVNDSMVAGIPKWLETDAYDLNAKSPSPNADNESLRLMLRSLLAERFKLQTHYEDQPRPVYALTAPTHRGRLKESDGSERSNCTSAANDNGQVTLTCINMTMAQFAEKIRNYAGSYFDHPVVDMTGLKAAFDFTLSWTAKARFLPTAGTQSPGASEPPGGITALQAVEKLLGDKIELQKQPQKVLVIDQIERKPIEN